MRAVVEASSWVVRPTVPLADVQRKEPITGASVLRTRCPSLLKASPASTPLQACDYTGRRAALSSVPSANPGLRANLGLGGGHPHLQGPKSIPTVSYPPPTPITGTSPPSRASAFLAQDSD